MYKLILDKDGFYKDHNVDGKPRIIHIPVIAQRVICNFKETNDLDIFSQIILDFLRISNKPSLLEISSLIELPITTVRRIANDLIDNGYLDKSFNVINVHSQNVIIKIGYIFYERVTGLRLKGLYLLENVKDKPKYEELEKNDKYIRPNKSIKTESINDILSSLKDWCSRNSDDLELGELIDIKIDETNAEYFLPLTLYFNKGEIHWKVQDLFNKWSYSIDLKKYLDKIKYNNKTLKNIINELCSAGIDNQYNKERNEKTDYNVVLKYGKEVRSLLCFSDLVKLENNINSVSGSKQIDSKIHSSTYNQINKIMEFTLVSELNRRNIRIKSKNILKSLAVLLSCGFNFNIESNLDLVEFKKWIKELNIKRKNAAHFGNDPRSEKSILKDYEQFKRYLAYFFNLNINNNVQTGALENYNFRTQRIEIEELQSKWSFLPIEILYNYTLYNLTKSGIDRAKFWEAVLYWYIHKEGLVDTELITGWRVFVQSKFPILGNEKLHKLFEKPPGRHYLEAAIEGNKATLGAYAYLIFLSKQHEGNSQLKAVLGNYWWNDLLDVMKQRNNHV